VFLEKNPRYSGCNQSCIETIQNVYNTQSKYWKCLKFNKKLPDYDVAESPAANVPDHFTVGEFLAKEFQEKINLSQELVDNKENQKSSTNQNASPNLEETRSIAFDFCKCIRL
jgi:hypothetical protein